MKILALEPYYGGSHRAFLDGWSTRSSHKWTILSLPAYKWKWRMRHAAVTFSQNIIESNEKWDCIFCSDMLNLAEFLGLTSRVTSGIPAIAYFHENQMAYPVKYNHERDHHFAATNMTTAFCANQVWFNSNFHRREFLEHLGRFLRKMPDYQPFEVVDAIEEKSHVFPPGIEEYNRTFAPGNGPVRIVWAARWEYDKDPETFFKALRIVKSGGKDFRLIVIGETFQNVPGIFDTAKSEFAAYIDQWGYLESRNDYLEALGKGDIVVSTAQHEFFGISIVEAIAAGAFPVLPERLSYPEIIDPGADNNKTDFYYEGDHISLARKLSVLIDRFDDGGRENLWNGNPGRCIRSVRKFYWENLVPVLDKAIEEIL